VSARAALLAVATLLGCAEVHDGATVVRFWAMGREGEMVERLVADFERDNPDIRVRVQQIPWSAAHEKLLTAYVGDAVPDVLQAGNTWLPELVALEALEPLDAWIARPDGVDPADEFPGILATNVVDGTTWGVPVVRRHARPVLSRRPARGGRASARAPQLGRVARGDGAVKAREAGGWPLLLPLREWQPLVILALQQGSTLLRDGGRFGDFRGPAFRRAFDFYLGLFRDGLAPGTGEAGVANLYQDFASGFVAMTITGPWNLGEFARAFARGGGGRLGDGADAGAGGRGASARRSPGAPAWPSSAARRTRRRRGAWSSISRRPRSRRPSTA
jgi:multiple sugar transport system substrate-binding protein